MSDIEWTDMTVNPVVGCSKISEGCKHCYAINVAGRQLSEHHRGLTVVGNSGQNWTGEVRMVPSVLGRKLPKRRDGEQRRVFVNSMSDWFHEALIGTEEGRRYVASCFGWMISQPWCDFQLLTKRPDGLDAWLEWLMHSAAELPVREGKPTVGAVGNFLVDCMWWSGVPLLREMARSLLSTFEKSEPRSAMASSTFAAQRREPVQWPPRNVLFGVTCENQERADERLPIMVELRRGQLIDRVFVSYEPALGPLDISRWIAPVDRYEDGGPLPGDNGPQLQWLICGGESGRGARPMHPDWARSARDQAVSAGVPFLFKQWGAHAPWVTEEWFTHGGAEKRAHTWVAADGRTGACWITDDDGLWSNWTGDPPIRPGASGHEATVDVALLSRIGKKAAGRELDGRTWDEMPTF